MNTAIILVSILGAVLVLSAVAVRQEVKEGEEVTELVPTPSLLPSGTPVNTESPVATPSATPEPQAVSTLPPQPSLQGSSPSPTTTPQAAPSPLAIRTISLPTSVQGGQEFDIRWTVDGPAGSVVDQTSAEVVYTQNGNGSSVNSRSEQSFGSTFVGKEHVATFSFGSGPGTITVTLRAVIRGKEVTSAHTITVR